MRFFNFVLAYMVQKYQNENAPMFNYAKSPKTNRKHQKIPYLQALTLGHVIKMTLYNVSRVRQERNIWYHILLTKEHEFICRFSKLVLRPRVQSGSLLGLLVWRGLANVLGPRHPLGLDVEAVQARLKPIKPGKGPE